MQNVFKPLGEPWFDFYILFSLPIAFIVSGLVGLALERGVIRFLYGRPLETLLATWGVSLILRQFVRSVNWLLIINIAVFCLFFFGGMTILKRRSNWNRIRNWAITILLTISSGISIALGFILNQAGILALTKPWFSARNVDVTAPTWLRGGLKVWGFQMPYARLFIIALTIICLIAVYWFLKSLYLGFKNSGSNPKSQYECLSRNTYC